ncbi:MAG TPA: alpha/beta hydrolase [Mycobacteriales bacterium]|nr:alpha/beta hydrolase [Mycobacteriales bacterium]
MHVRDDEGSGPAVVLLHGQPGTAAEWSRVTPLLAGHGLRVLTVDRPGYGETGGAARDWAGNAEALIETLDERAIDAAIIVGYSWAGGVALETALTAPERVRGLVLMGSVGHPSALTRSDRILAFRPVNKQLSRVMDRVGPRAVRILKAVSGSAVDEDAESFLTSEAAQWKANGTWNAFAQEQDFLVRDTRALSKRLPEVTTPALLLHGWKDDVVPLKAGGALAAALPNARLKVVEGGHMLNLEHPEVVAEAIVTFAEWLP